MNDDPTLRELLLLPDGPPEGVWQAAMAFAFTSENETPDHLLAGINPDNTSLTPDADEDGGVDSDEAREADETDDLSPARFEDHGDDVGPALHTSTDSSGTGNLDEAGEDYGG